jgi:hypothetical protein
LTASLFVAIVTVGATRWGCKGQDVKEDSRDIPRWRENDF